MINKLKKKREEINNRIEVLQEELDELEFKLDFIDELIEEENENKS